MSWLLISFGSSNAGVFFILVFMSGELIRGATVCGLICAFMQIDWGVDCPIRSARRLFLLSIFQR